MILTKKMFDLMGRLKELHDKSDKIMAYYTGGKSLSEDFLRLSQVSTLQHKLFVEGESVTDYSLRAFLLRNFRRFGTPTDNADYYGMYVAEEEKGENHDARLFILGRNGVGKSSLFDAAEYLFTGTIGEACYRKIKLNDFIHSDFEGQEIQALTGAGHFTLQSPPSVINNLPVGNFFVSENSIIKSLAKIHDGNFYPFLCELLGLGNLYELSKCDLLEEMSNLISEMPKDTNSSKQELDSLLYSNFFILSQQSLNSLQNCKSRLSVIVDKLALRIGKREDLQEILDEVLKIGLSKFRFIKPVNQVLDDLSALRQRYKMVTSEVIDSSAKSHVPSDVDKEKRDKAKNDIVTMITFSINSLYAQLNDILTPKDDKQLLKELKTRLDKYLDDEANKSNLSAKASDETAKFYEDLNYVRQQLGDSLAEYVSTICDESFVECLKSIFDNTFVNSAIEKFEIDVHDIQNGIVRITINDIPANRYFNTFRFRLLFIMIQTSICLMLMKFTKWSFPIFFDDIFYANDYNNKNELVKFFKVLDSQSKKMLPQGMPFQYIFFSHDEQLLYALFDDENIRGKYCRIINTESLDISDLVNKAIDIDGKKIKYKNVYVEIFQ